MPNKNSNLDYYCTPTWAETILIGQIKGFTDDQLHIMQIFIADEVARRSIRKQEASCVTR